MEKKVTYSAIVLDEKSRSKILSNLFIPDGWKIIAHHCTICLKGLPDEWKDRIGETIQITATEWGKTQKAIAIKIDDFERLMPGTSHVTVAINEEIGGKPKDSNEIDSWHFMGTTLNLTGTIEEL